MLKGKEIFSSFLFRPLVTIYPLTSRMALSYANAINCRKAFLTREVGHAFSMDRHANAINCRKAFLTAYETIIFISGFFVC